MTEQLGLVMTHAPGDSRLHTALRLLRAWRQSQLPVFGIFLQGDGVTLAQPGPGQNGAAATALLDFCAEHSITVNACVGSCQQRALCDARGKPIAAGWDARVGIAGLGELSTLLSDCSRVVSL